MRTANQLKNQIRAASGAKKPELVLKNAHIVNVFTETIEEADVAVEGGYIVGVGHYEGIHEVDLNGRYLCPGFIDGHIHLESAMVSPYEFQRLVVPHGTTTVVTDPHEIANVAGIQGIEYMLESTEGLDLTVYFMLPSCVPATALDESGAKLLADDLAPLLQNDRVLGLAEMMDAVGVVLCDDRCIDKIEAVFQKNGMIDGHAPMLSGRNLNAYIAAGVQTDHECSNIEEAKEKIARGQWVMIREGTAAKNLDSLLPLFEAPYYQRALLVTDDKHPGDLLRGGHIDAIIRKAVKAGADPVRAIRMGTWHAAQCFQLRETGAVAPGYKADLVVFDDLSAMNILSVYKDGRLVAGDNCYYGSVTDRPGSAIEYDRVFHSFHMRRLTVDDLMLEPAGEHQRVIDLMAHEIMTRERIAKWQNNPGYAPGVDIRRDIIKLAVCERHRGTGHIGLGFLGHYGLKRGAVATSIGHDSHNLLIAGVNDGDMVLAGNKVLENEGGLAIAVDGRVVADLPLVIGGLMADGSAEEVDKKLEHMKEILKSLGVPEDIDGLMTLGFVSLPVIPKLRLNTCGLIDVEQQKCVPVSF